MRRAAKTHAMIRITRQTAEVRSVAAGLLGKWDDADFAEHRDIERNIGDCHEHRPGDGAARAQFLRADRMLDRRRRVSHCVNDALAVRHFARQELDDFCFD